MIRSYTISSLKDISLFPFLERVQFTLNMRRTPSQRKAVEALKMFPQTKTEVFIHYDFYRTLPRYLRLTEQSQKEMVKELVDIMILSKQERFTLIKGIIIHVDSCFAAPLLKKMDELFAYKPFNFDEMLSNLIAGEEKSRIYKDLTPDIISDYIPEYRTLSLKSFLKRWYEVSALRLYCDIIKEASSRNEDLSGSAKIFLENTAHLVYKSADDPGPGSVSHITQIAMSNPFYGVCYDMEHAFAAGDVEFDSLDFTLPISRLIHFNTIEEGVERGSGRDRHSMTTIFECSKHDSQYYISLAKKLDELKVPYVREVKSETMLREIDQFKDYE